MSERTMTLREALRLIYIVDPEGAADGDRLDAVLGGGATALWLRAPDRPGADLYRIGRTLKQRCVDHGAALLVGDRADVALAVEADGVQLGHRSPPADRIRPFFPGWLGVSCHGADDLQRAEGARADFAVLSPLFGVPAKGPPLGPEAFALLVSGTELPIVALGGIETANVGEARVVGAAGVAVIRALRDAADPASDARRLRAATDAS